MTEIISSPDLHQSEQLLAELFEDVKKWEGSLAGGTQLDVGAAAIDSLFETKVSFGNPRANLVPLTPAIMKEAGVELSAVIAQQMERQFDFYYITVSVDMRPKPGAQFKQLICQLNFGPKGENEPIVQTIFPQSKWRPVLTWGGGLNLGLNSELGWEVGLDTGEVSDILDLPADLRANVSNANAMKGRVVIPDYAYEVGRFDIAAYGEGNSECYWLIQEPNLQQQLTLQFAIVFKVPQGTAGISLEGIAWAEPNMSWLVANLRNVFRVLKDNLQGVLRLKEKSAKQFARGAREHWILDLPR